MWATKGTRVHVRVFVSQPIGSFSIAGAQMKTTGQWRELTGTITHVRGDHPTNPVEIGIWVQPDGGGPEEGPFRPASVTVCEESEDG